MIEEGRPCLDLAQQLHAVESAISNAKRELIHDHIEHCLGDGIGTIPEARAPAPNSRRSPNTCERHPATILDWFGFGSP